MAEKKVDKVRVLQVLGSTGLGGAESRIMDLYRHIDREKVTFDFLVHMDAGLYAEAGRRHVPPETLRKPEFYDHEIKKLGGMVYCLPRFRVYNYMVYKRAAERFFEEHRGYDVVHGHMTSTASIYLPVAKKYGVPVTIAHARSAGVDAGIKGILTGIMRKNLWKKADYLFACSELAAKAVFGEHETVFIPNAIDTSKFVFDQELRTQIRSAFSLNETTVLYGHVGRFHYAKNHEYLLRVFREILSRQSDSRLLLLGEGPGMEKQKVLAKELGIEENVIFAGNRENPQAYYHAMDCFIFPSRYEGLPGTVVEAQASGLPCLISDAIAKETAVTDLVKWENIGKEPYIWAKQCIKMTSYGGKERKAYAQIVADKGFDVLAQAAAMQRFYSREQ